MSRVIVYIDGFNLYYGALKGTPYKWLDIVALARRLAPNDHLVAVRYFTARVRPQPSDPQQPQRQQAYLRALGTFPLVTIHLGHYLSHATRMPLATPKPGKSRTVEVIKTEEKGSDVNLATYLLLDAFRGRCDKAVVVTNDSDLQEPIPGGRAGARPRRRDRQSASSATTLTRFAGVRHASTPSGDGGGVPAAVDPYGREGADDSQAPHLVAHEQPSNTEAHPKVGLGLAAEATRGMIQYR
jgi:hypothetical protein